MLQEKTGKEDVDVGNIRPTLYHLFGKDASPKFKKFMKILFKRFQEDRLNHGGSGHGGIMGLLSGIAQEVLKFKDEEEDEDEEEEVESETEAYAGTKKNLPNNGVLISGCQSDQTSADANSPQGAYGACSNAIQALIAESDGQVTNRDLVLNVRKLLAKQGFTQKPGLYCTDKHVDYPFICWCGLNLIFWSFFFLLFNPADLLILIILFIDIDIDIRLESWNWYKSSPVMELN